MKKTWLVSLAMVLFMTIGTMAQVREYQGEASVYPIKKYGKLMLSGEYLSSRFLIASSNDLPVGSVVEVTNLSNKKAVTLRIADKGTSNPAHVLEITHSAAQALGMIGGDVRNVRVLVLVSGEKPTQTASTVKKEPEFPMNFPVYEKIKLDTAGRIKH